MRRVLKYIFLVLLVIVVDQAVKLWVHGHMELGLAGHINLVGNLFGLTYVLNYGMAFGLQWSFKYGKLLMTGIRLAISLGIVRHIFFGFLRSAPTGWVVGWVLILAGALGNSIDGVLYGVYLDNAPDTAVMKWFHGQTIDMLHLDVWSGTLPNWFPIVGGEVIALLPIFNIADVSICSGLLCILYCYRQIAAWEKSIRSIS
ncbi:signal peptidase II [Candidatus Cardinium hertigii]|uniref:Lipoprotein signal peptidase n=1 Tax=Candidatus Cardinium hertigii TaxID=247481 RepID=A0A2Z3LH54_9BACT|nr:signal peptidase II [Candidatus Cardinium hertigii]AWN81380.1 Lipoprotein signal peptidase [Candidatus Cardinium hertigii]